MCLLHSYILYDVNPSEGFNLRRDVYVRIAVFLKGLAKKDKEFRWHLVLPPWGKLEICFRSVSIFYTNILLHV